MKRLLWTVAFLTAFVFSMDAQNNYSRLWSKVQKAEKEGKPQTAAGYLRELEQKTIAAGDELEQLAVSEKLYEQLGKYNWKEANSYYHTYATLNRRVLTDSLEAYIVKYKDHPRVMKLLYQRLCNHKDALDRRSRSMVSGADYKALRKEAETLLKHKYVNGYKTTLENFIETLDAPHLSTSGYSYMAPARDVTYTLSTCNVDRVSVRVFRLDDNVLFEPIGDKDLYGTLSRNGTQTAAFEVTGFKNDYYMGESLDTKVDFPVPGIYVVCFEAKGAGIDYDVVQVSNVAGALRVRGGQAEIYAADFTTGKPYPEGTYSIYKNLYEKRSTTLLKLKPYLTGRFAGAGFVPVETGKAVSDHKNDYLLRIEAGNDIYAPLVSGLNDYYMRPASDTEDDYMFERTELFTDRALYKPTDTIYFKVICYKASETRGEVLANKSVDLVLRHSSSPDTVAQVKLLTNDMGSASGFFTLPAGSKNGRYYIQSRYQTLKSIRVEEYKRPNFNVSLTPVADVLCFGDVVKQTGTLQSFAGFSVAGGEVEYSIERRCFCAYKTNGWYTWHETVDSGMTLSDNKGSFTINFLAERPKYPGLRPEDMQDLYKADYFITIRAADPQGEVHEARISVPVADIPIDMNILLPEGQTFAGKLIVDKDNVKAVTVEGSTLNGTPYGFTGTYTVTDAADKEVKKGRFTSNEPVAFDFGALPSGQYTMKARTEYRGREITTERTVIVMSTDDRTLPFESRYFYYPVKTEGVLEFVLGTSEDDLYLELEVFDNDKVLYCEHVHLQKEMRKFHIDYDPSWRSAVQLVVFGIRDGKVIDNMYQFTRPGDVRLDVAIETFRDKTTPATEETMTIRAPEGSELLVSIYDVTTDRMGANSFSFYPLREYPYVGRPSVYTTFSGHYRVYRNMVMAKAAGAMVEMEEVPMMRGAVLEDAVVEMADHDAASEESGEEKTPEFEGRTNFSELIAFYPHLRADQSGVTTVKYTTTDLLSTFRVLVMAHDKRMFVGSDETQFVVNKELMVMPNVPLFATQGDRIVLKSKLVNLSDKQVKGTAYIELSDDQGRKLKLKGTGSQKRTLLAGAQDEVAWGIEVPGGTTKLTAKIWFATPTASDGEQHEIQIVPNTVTLTEAASFIIGKGHDHKYYEKQLRQQFGAANPKIEYATYSTLDAVKQSLPAAQKPTCENSINWINQLYINQMRNFVLKDDPADYAAFREQAFSALKTFQENDGSFAWFRGMKGNNTITLYILEKLGQLRQVGALTLTDSEEKMVRKALASVDEMVDLSYARSKDFHAFAYIRAYAVRSLWFDVPLSDKAKAVYQKFIKGTEDGWQDISILEKAQLCNTMLRAAGTPYDDKSFTKRIKLLRESLKDYAVENERVGCYFPNAVMPFRGLMNSEIYAHAQLMELFAALGEPEMVDGIAQWLLLQKHNQAWESTVATTDAVHALIASKAKDLKFGAVYYTYTTQLAQVKPSGDELRVTRVFLRNGQSLIDGEKLHVGDKVTVRYQIYNTENRSFVELRAMRPACFYPVDERSYFTWYGFYREVKPSETSYYWELLPEEHTTVTEEFYVTQEGTFNSGLVAIECLYAPEYRGHTDTKTLTSK